MEWSTPPHRDTILKKREKLFFLVTRTQDLLLTAFIYNMQWCCFYQSLIKDVIIIQLLDGREFEWTLGVGDGQGGLACCDSWGRKESHTTQRLNLTQPSLYMSKTSLFLNWGTTWERDCLRLNRGSETWALRHCGITCLCLSLTCERSWQKNLAHRPLGSRATAMHASVQNNNSTQNSVITWMKKELDKEQIHV